MPNIFVISDTWFNRLLVNEPNANVVETNEHIVKNWNETVSKEDKVYILGGLGIGDLYHILIAMHGEIHILNNIFNEDEKMYLQEMKEAIAKSSDPSIANKFVFEDNQILVLNELDSVLSYYPIEEWPGKSSGTYCFHGFNESMNITDRNIACCSLMWDGKPVNIKEVQKNIDTFNNRI